MLHFLPPGGGQGRQEGSDYGIFITVYLYEWPVMQLNPGWSIPIEKNIANPHFWYQKNTVNLAVSKDI